MKRQITFIVAFLFLISCDTTHKPRNIKTVNVETFTIERSSIRAIVAVDEQTVYYAGSSGDVGFTNDGGKTWAREFLFYQDTIKPNFRSIAKNGTDIFALSIENPALLYKISQQKKSLVYKENQEKVFYDSLHFFEDGTHAIAVGDPTDTCASIILSADGGTTWSKLDCSQLPFFEEGEAFFAASNTNIKTLGSTVWIASGGKKARILKSVDFGNTWQIYQTPIVQGNGPEGIYSIDFHDQNNGIIIGGNYEKPKANFANKALTTDGGKTWTLVADGKDPAYKSCVQYVPNTNGKEIFAVGITGISFSNDGGFTWQEISKEAFYTIQFVNKNTAWLSGSQKMGKLTIAKKSKEKYTR